jgi:fatty-acyl-CoA synthase
MSIRSQLEFDTEIHSDRVDWEPSTKPVGLIKAATVGQALLRWAEHDPQAVACYIQEARNGTMQRLTVTDLVDCAAEAAQALRERGVRRGDRVAVCLDTGRDVMSTLFGCALLGAVPVILEPPMLGGRRKASQTRMRRILQVTAARALVTDARYREVDIEVIAETGVMVVQPPYPQGSQSWQEPPDNADELAFIQFTSGTVGDAKGVAVTHRGLFANAAALGARTPYFTGDVSVGWLPLYHDMGLVGITLAPFLHTIPVVLLSPLTFIAAPERWLQAIHRFRGTLSPAPNFGYQLCVKNISDDRLAGIDLRSWRVAYNGAEFIDARTLRAWQARMGPLGFVPEAMRPSYGMAELTLAATLCTPCRLPRIMRISRAALAGEGLAIPAENAGPDVQEVVSLGTAVDGHRVCIVDECGTLLPERRQGNVLVSGPSLMKGYYGEPDKTADAIRDGWFGTGDLGFIVDDELYITGRTKDLIIIAGCNYHPYPIEAAAATVLGIRNGGTAAVGHFDPELGTEALVVLIETPMRDSHLQKCICTAVEREVADQTGLRPRRVVAVKPGALPKTPSGKLQRPEILRLLMAGEYQPHVRPE